MYECQSCATELKGNVLSNFVYYHCTRCRLEYLLTAEEDFLLKMLFKYKDGIKHISVQWDFKNNQTSIVIDRGDAAEKTIMINHIINVKYIDDIPNKIKTYLVFS